MSDLSFEPKSENELITLLSPGIGSYEVYHAEAKISKNGNPMIELILRVWDDKGNTGQIYDYLILNEHKFSLRKIRHFCYASGIGELYEKGALNANDCINRYGKLKIIIQEDKLGKYPDKNSVDDYVFIVSENNKQNSSNSDNTLDTIPF
jgi:hypothetical protein